MASADLDVVAEICMRILRTSAEKWTDVRSDLDLQTLDLVVQLVDALLISGFLCGSEALECRREQVDGRVQRCKRVGSRLRRGT
jgi:hypothetical protein